MILIAGLISFGWLGQHARTAQSPRADANNIAETSCQLLRVIDGDTIRVNCNNEVYSIRLLRINTPERGRRGFEDATRALKDILGHDDLTVRFETPTRPEKDRFGRTLGYVFVGDTKNASIEIVRRGWSTYWTKYGYGKYRTAFESAEQEARMKHSGLWSFDTPPSSYE